MCKSSYRYHAQPSGAWVDCEPGREKTTPEQDADLSYWSELGMCYQPEWFPLGAKLIER